jgi:hypothetical protein
MKQRLAEQLDQRWEATKTSLSILATHLDPRTKDLEMCSKWMQLEDYIAKFHSHLPQAEAPKSVPQAPRTGGGLKKAMAEMLGPVRAPSSLDFLGEISLQLMAFRGETPLPMWADEENKIYNDPCLWWRQNKQKYPRLVPIAQRVTSEERGGVTREIERERKRPHSQLLSIPATSVPCERMASAAGAVVTPKKASLTPSHVEQRTCAIMNSSLALAFPVDVRRTWIVQAEQEL